MKITKKQHIIYDIVISSLALVAIVLVIIDLSEELSAWQRKIDDVILAVFVIDYAVRFWAADDKKEFVKHNICDLIAILPYYTFFRAFKILRFNKLFKFAALPRAFAFAYRPFRKAKLFLDTNGFKYVLFITGVLIGIGGVLIHFAEGMSLSDGIWWAFVTATTVGYGDISPRTMYGRFIAMLLMLVGIGLIGTVTSTITSYFLRNNKKKGVSNEMIEMVKEKLDDFDSLSEEDIEIICKILKDLKSK